MNKEIKIIDLLNLIAEGKEVPKRIKYVKYNYEAYTYDNDIKDYISDRGNYGLFTTATLTYILNDTVEIIEEDNKKIEKLKYHNSIPDKEDIEEYKQFIKEILKNENCLMDKINEIIDKINNMEE